MAKQLIAIRLSPKLLSQHRKMAAKQAKPYQSLIHELPAKAAAKAAENFPRALQMKNTKRAKLEAAGWAVGSVKEFLGLSEAESALIDMKLALSRSLRERRTKQGLSQVQLAERLQSSQSRVAKMEAGDPSVSMDLLVSSLILLGAISGEGRGKNGRAA